MWTSNNDANHVADKSDCYGHFLLIEDIIIWNWQFCYDAHICRCCLIWATWKENVWLAFIVTQIGKSRRLCSFSIFHFLFGEKDLRKSKSEGRCKSAWLWQQIRLPSFPLAIFPDRHLLQHCTCFCILCIVYYYTLYIVYCQSFQTDTQHLLEHCSAVVQQKNSLDREKHCFCML